MPARLLLDPLAASAQAAEDLAILILNTSHYGEPTNCNAPGMYRSGLTGVVHPSQASMTPTQLQLGEQTHTAAKPWADLGASILDRTACIHHATYTGIHARQDEVMRLMGNTARGEMFPSIVAKYSGSRLNTTMQEPVTIGAKWGQELLQYEGRTLSNVAPTSLKRVLGAPEGPLANLQAQRDQDLDRIYALYRDHGTANQRTMLDRFATTRESLRSLALALLDQLSSIEDDSPEAQVTAAPVLAAMRISPVITLHIPFGGDNHFDDRLEIEASQHVSGFDQMRRMLDSIASFRTQGLLNVPVVTATLGVFGRTLEGNSNGRAHHAGHHVTILTGDSQSSSVQAGVIGGCDRSRGKLEAMQIDATTGEGVPDGMGGSSVVPFDETLQATARTIAAAVGLPEDYLDENITGGRTLESALS